MTRFALMLARFLLSAWFGAAVLFVIIGVREVTHPGFDSLIRDQLVVLRFPAYYACGFTLLGAVAVSLVLGLIFGARRRVMSLALVLTLAALGLMAYDYPFIYTPLAEMITPPGQVRSPEFRRLHFWSETVNGVQIVCVLAAALVVCGSQTMVVRPAAAKSADAEPVRSS